ncbi:helix-turn-helix domain-containing protein [Isoptericola halotolerans]|uniref:Transposase n=1 Tax=Isoptericola halotolerans TaxID=300560 RepID=A0ABX2A5N5_9MICO|nr:helix-turn-helix domain-containing protein [Isoptericola halotolerans]NOV98174.1 transposase [Isoptericola halotolerans]
MNALTVRDVAEREQTSTQTVRGWLQRHELDGYRTQGTRGPWRVAPEDYEKFRQARKAMNADPWARTRARRTTS